MMMKHRNSIRSRHWLAVLLVCALLTVSLFAGCKNKSTVPETTAPAETTAAAAVTDIENYTVKDLTVDDPRMDEVVATCAGYELNNRQFAIYYWMQFISVMNQYGGYINIDLSKPMSEQGSPTEGMSWEQLFVQAAADQFRSYAAVASEAKAEGFELSQELEDRIAETLDTIDQQAAARNYASADEYLQASFGPGVTKQDYADYLHFFYYVMSYETEKYDQMDKSCTDEDIDAFYEAHKQSYVAIVANTKCIDVRHILVMPSDVEGETEEEKLANAKSKAEAIYLEYLEDPTEDHFAELAMTHSSDPGSASNGGLYEKVLEGKMVAPFNDWCFAEERKPGDTDIVQTDYGFHVMYFVGADDYLRMTVREDYLNERLNTWVTELVEANPVTADYAKIALGEVNLSQSN